MKILVVGYFHPKYDKRVFRTVRAFSKVCDVVYQYSAEEDEESHREGNIWYVPLRRRKPRQHEGFQRIVPKVLEKAITWSEFDKGLLRILENEQYDIVYFHHFPLTMPTKVFRIAKERGKKIIFDIHEYHPENFLKSLKGAMKKVKEIIAWRFFRKQIELSDKLVFVSEETMSDILAHVGVKKPTLVVPNYASCTVTPTEKRKEIVLVGKTPRGLSQEKKILEEIVKRGIKFRIIGMDQGFLRDIPHEYTNFLPYDKMMVELSKAMFSLVSYSTTGNERYKNDVFALPHKFFDSLAAGTPVIVKSTFISMVKEIEKYNIGIVIDPKDVEASVRKILNAFENYDFYRQNVGKHKHLFVWDEEKEENFLKFILES